MNDAVAVRQVRLNKYPGIALGFASHTRPVTERQPIFQISAEFNAEGGVRRVWNAERVVFGSVPFTVKVNLLYLYVPLTGPCLFTTPIKEITMVPPARAVFEIGQLVVVGDAATTVLIGEHLLHRTIDVPAPPLIEKLY